MSAAPKRGGGSTAKAFVSQIYSALQSSSRSTPTINGVDCSRLWIQGVVVGTSEDREQCTIDDGTGVLRLELKVFLKNAPPGVDAQPQLGDCIMAIGPIQKAKTNGGVPSIRTLLAHQVVKMDAKLQREPMWFLEVIEYWTSVVDIV